MGTQFVVQKRGLAQGAGGLAHGHGSLSVDTVCPK